MNLKIIELQDAVQVKIWREVRTDGALENKQVSFSFQRFYAGCFGAFLVYRYWKSSVRKNHERISEHRIAEYYEKKAKQREKMMENAVIINLWTFCI